MDKKYRGFVDDRTRTNAYVWLRGIEKLPENTETLACEINLDLLTDHDIDYEFTTDGDLWVSESLNTVRNLAICKPINTGKYPNYQLYNWEQRV